MLPARVTERVADQMHDALLDDRMLPGGVDRVREAFEPVAHGDQHVVDTSVLSPASGWCPQFGEHLQPEPGALGTVTRPDSQDVAFAVHRDAHHDIEGGVAHWGHPRAVGEPSRTFTTIASTKITGYSGSKGREDHSASSPVTFSVIRLIVSFEILAP